MVVHLRPLAIVFEIRRKTCLVCLLAQHFYDVLGITGSPAEHGLNRHIVYRRFWLGVKLLDAVAEDIFLKLFYPRLNHRFVAELPLRLTVEEV